MADNRVILKKSSVASKVPTTSDLEFGELAVNYTDGKIYYKDSSNNIRFFEEGNTIPYTSESNFYTNGYYDFGSNQIYFANVFDNLSDLPSASVYHGMFAHVHGTGKAYYAHAGNWVEIGNNSDIPANLSELIINSDTDFGSNKILYSNVYSNLGDLPSASTYHGMFAHVHATGRGYFAHAGNWVPLANSSEIFRNVAVPGETTLTANSSDTLTLIEGQGIAITTDGSTNELTITASGSAGNDFVNSAAFDDVNGDLTLTRTDSGTVSVNLDGRYLTAETTTAISFNNSTNILSYTDENLSTTDIDLSLYLDDTNLARLVNGTLDGTTGIATFTRDDNTTFTVDFSPLFDDTNLARITSASFDTANGILTLSRDDASTVTTDLDGRYLLSGAKAADADLLDGQNGTHYLDYNNFTNTPTLYGSSDFNTDFSTKSTSDLSEGLSNLYYTDTRVRNALSVSGDLGYDPTTGTFSFTERTDSQVRALFSASGDLSYDSATGNFSVTVPAGYDSSDFDVDFGNKSTDDLTEGASNLYYTNSRVDSHLSGGTGVSYSFGTISIGQAVGPNDNVGFNNVTVNGTLSTDDITATTVTASNDVIIQGDLTVQGTTTSTNTNEITTESPTITLVEGLDSSTAPSQNAGLIVNRGSSPDAFLRWNEATDFWEFAGVNPGGSLGRILTANDVGNGTLTVSGGSGLTGSGTFDANQSSNSSVTINHADTSSQGSVNNSGSTVIQDVTLDGFGHVTNLNSKTLTALDVGALSTTGKAADADLLDGNDSPFYLNYNNFTNTPTIGNGTLTVSGGSGLTGSGTFDANQTTNASITVNHADTSTQGSVNGSGNTFIQDVTLDGFGHVTGLGTATVVIPDTANDATITVSAGNGLIGGGNFTTDQATNETITVNHADTSTQGSVNNSGSTVIQDVTLDGFGHVTGLASKSLSASDVGALGVNDKAVDSNLLDGLDSSAFLQSESDTLDSVTNRGNSTPNTVSAGEVESDLFFRNKDTVSSNRTVPNDGYNSMSVGPITISDGTTITVQDGARWVVI
jgi:hypothetical protein